MKRGKPTFPSLFTFYSQFAALHRVSRDIPVTAAKAFGQGEPYNIRYSKRSQLAGATDFFSFSSCNLRSSRQRAYCSALAGSGSSSSFSQKQNQSTAPCWEVILSQALTTGWSPCGMK